MFSINTLVRASVYCCDSLRSFSAIPTVPTANPEVMRIAKIIFGCCPSLSLAGTSLYSLNEE